MNTENEKQQNQLRALLLQPKAILKLIVIGVIWQLLGVLLGIMFNPGIMLISIALFFGLLWLTPYWQPAYSIVYQIVGDQSVSPILETNLNKLKWWHYIPILIKLTFIAYILYIGIRLFFQ